MAAREQAPDETVVARVRVDVIDPGARVRTGRIPCVIGGDLTFSTEHLESYCLTQWEPIVYDALVVTAAVEFCDRVRRRNAQQWGRDIELRAPFTNLSAGTPRPSARHFTTLLHS